jgi:hypothetical protein
LFAKYFESYLLTPLELPKFAYCGLCLDALVRNHEKLILAFLGIIAKKSRHLPQRDANDEEYAADDHGNYKCGNLRANPGEIQSEHLAKVVLDMNERLRFMNVLEAGPVVV